MPFHIFLVGDEAFPQEQRVIENTFGILVAIWQI